MDTVVYLTSILMWILCPAIIGLILLQGAAGDISSAFGGGGQLDASLGVGAHRKMAQVTGALAVLFFIMVLLMAYPHRGSFQDVKGAPAAKPPATIPLVAPETKTPPAADPEAKPVEAVATPEPKPEAAKPEAAKPEAPAATVQDVKPIPTPDPAAAPTKP
jgi:protein translocase SecG subunit